MRNVLKLCLGLLFALSVSDLSLAGDSVNPMPELGGSNICTVSSNPAHNVGVCVNVFGGDNCVPGGVGTIGPRCNGTAKPL